MTLPNEEGRATLNPCGTGRENVTHDRDRMPVNGSRSVQLVPQTLPGLLRHYSDSLRSSIGTGTDPADQIPGVGATEFRSHCAPLVIRWYRCGLTAR